MKHPAREKRKQQVIDFYNARYPHISIADIEKETGHSYRTIYRYLSEAGLPLPPRKQRQVDIDKVRQAHKLYAEHQNKSKVARIMKMSPRQIGRYLDMSVE